MNAFTVTISGIDTAEPSLDAACMALLFGVTVADVHALPRTPTGIRIPREWVKRCRRRTKEAAADTGDDFIISIMRYWARRDHNAELVVVEE